MFYFFFIIISNINLLNLSVRVNYYLYLWRLFWIFLTCAIVALISMLETPILNHSIIQHLWPFLHEMCYTAFCTADISSSVWTERLFLLMNSFRGLCCLTSSTRIEVIKVFFIKRIWETMWASLTTDAFANGFKSTFSKPFIWIQGNKFKISEMFRFWSFLASAVFCHRPYWIMHESMSQG